MRLEVKPAKGVGPGFPAVSALKWLDTCDEGELMLTIAKRFTQPPIVRDIQNSVQAGQRRSASITSTRRAYDSLSVRARLTTVSVFPSCGSALVIITVLSCLCTCSSCSAAASLRVLLERHGTRRPGDQTSLDVCVVGQLRSREPAARREVEAGRRAVPAQRASGVGSSRACDSALRARTDLNEEALLDWVVPASDASAPLANFPEFSVPDHDSVPA